MHIFAILPLIRSASFQSFMKDNNKSDLSILRRIRIRRRRLRRANSKLRAESLAKRGKSPSCSADLARKMPYRKLFATAPDHSRKCGRRNATLEITRPTISAAGRARISEVTARGEFLAMELRAPFRVHLREPTAEISSCEF